jgi:hypothetical protein
MEGGGGRVGGGEGEPTVTVKVDCRGAQFSYVSHIDVFLDCFFITSKIPNRGKISLSSLRVAGIFICTRTLPIPAGGRGGWMDLLRRQPKRGGIF